MVRLDDVRGAASPCEKEEREGVVCLPSLDALARSEPPEEPYEGECPVWVLRIWVRSRVRRCRGSKRMLVIYGAWECMVPWHGTPP